MNKSKHNGPSERWLVSMGSDRTEVRLDLIRQGRDWVLLVGGGDAHVGAVAVQAATGEGVSADGPEMVVIPPHKEGPLAERAARRVAAATGRACVAVVGIHQDDATRDEIMAISANVDAGLDQLLATMLATENKAG